MTWEFLHRWYMPFVWITASSLIAVPVALYFQHGMTLHNGGELALPYGTQWALRDDFLATIVVYLLNIGAAVWLFNADGSTRWAAFWATLLGVSKLVLPVALAEMSDVTIAGNQHYVDWQTLRVIVWFQDAQMFALGLMVWAAFARFVGDNGAAVSRAAHFAEA